MFFLPKILIFLLNILPDHLEEDVLERLSDVEDVRRFSESPQALVDDVEEEGVLGVPKNILASVLDPQVFFLKLLDFLSLVFVFRATEVHELLEGYFPVVDGKQQGVEAIPCLVDLGFILGSNACEVRQVLLRR